MYKVGNYGLIIITIIIPYMLRISTICRSSCKIILTSMHKENREKNKETESHEGVKNE